MNAILWKTCNCLSTNCHLSTSSCSLCLFHLVLCDVKLWSQSQISRIPFHIGSISNPANSSRIFASHWWFHKDILFNSAVSALRRQKKGWENKERWREGLWEREWINDEPSREKGRGAASRNRLHDIFIFSNEAILFCCAHMFLTWHVFYQDSLQTFLSF